MNFVVGFSRESRACPRSRSFIVNGPSGDPKLMNSQGISRGLLGLFSPAVIIISIILFNLFFANLS